ncbi:MAG: 2-hydroxyacid dehydrogenase [Cyclobacteriaceae bacterium]|nr:2-hydroxyacid dehydrogenase [Cyclobacteriaceae bacterium]
MRVAVFSTKPYDKHYLDLANSGQDHEFVYFESSLRLKSLRLAENFDAVCVFVNDLISEEVIKGLAEQGVKLLVLRCAGFNNVDIESADNYGIRVLRVPSYSPTAVAEHTVALIMTLNRKTHKAYNRVREGNFSIERLTGFELSNKTVGIIGTGRIGASFARIMNGFGSKVIAYDQFPNESLQNILEYAPMEEVFKQADVLSLHCPLTPETFHLINKDSLQLMKKGVMIVNTSRGKLIDTEAVINGLKEGKVGYLGIDVYEQEERLFFKDLSESIILDDKIMRLMTFPNVLITAHQAYFTDNALTQIANTTVQNLTGFEKGILPEQNEVTLEMVH